MRLRLAAAGIVDAKRKALLDSRARAVIGDAAFQAVESELDLLMLN